MMLAAINSTALKVLTSGDEPDLIEAFAAQQLKMNGNFQTALWFGEVMAIAQSKPVKSPEISAVTS